MGRCEACGNDYDKSFQVLMAAKHHDFDSFECAIHDLATRCVHCHCRFIGHGIEHEDAIFCCAHCAAEAGVTGIVDRA